MYGKRVLFSQVALANICSVRFYKKDSTKKLLEFLADMPKSNSSRISEAQRLRQNITRKSEKYGPSTVYLQVLGSGAMGAPNTLYLFTDQKRYLFNCGECTQRLAHEHKVKLSRLDHIFITSKTWKNIGGLPGLSLTLQDVGVPSITLHGPDGLDELYNATKRFVIMKDMNVNMAKCSSSEDFEDNAISVKYVLLGPLDEILLNKEPKPVAKKPRLSDTTDKGFESFTHDDTDYYRQNMDANKPAADPKKFVKDRVIVKQKAGEKLPDPAKKKTEKVLHDLQKQSHCSVSYICTLKKRLGTLDLAKCVELGVKPGPMLGQLKSGHDVVLPDGTLVLSKDVKTPDDHGPVFIVLDIPEMSYLKESEFSSHFDNGTNPPENIPTLIVHYTPLHVFHNPAYRAFMTLFGPTPRHLILNSQNSCLGSEAVHRTQHKLHLLDPDIFPLLRDVSVPAVWNAHPPLPKTNSPVRLKGLEELKNKIALAQFQNIINMQASCKGDYRQSPGMEDPESDKLEFMAGRTLTMFHLRPKKQLDRSAEPKLHIQDYIQETMDVDGFVGSLEQFRRLVDSMRYARTDSQKEYPKVVFLGTGSCIPSKTRNTSAIVLHIDENRSMLLDCGEGTFGQLVRFYGPKRVNSILRTLKAIYVSHLHADHHIGLIGVLQARRRAFEELDHDMQEVPEPVYLMAPGQIVTWLSLYDMQFEKIRSDYTLIPNQSLIVDIPPQDEEMSAAILANIGVSRIQTCLVSHCPNAFGVAIEVEGYKITYSGDTIPCEALIKLGENSTLLIHEATMEDELAEEARTKMHSTTTQAIEIGRKMKAKYTILTHFSQRYARLPRLNANILNDNNSVGIAFDNMQITMNDLELLPHMYAPLQLMFADHCVEMELKAAQRARQKERRSAHQLIGDSEVIQKPPARNVLSSPLSRSPARYRESNSSRLRQEIKGMTLAGTVKTLRSKSSSPSKTPTPSSTPRSQNSGRSTPRMRRDLSPEKPSDIAAARALSGTQEAGKGSPISGKSTTRMRQDSPAEGVDVITPTRTVSATSNDSKDVDVRHPPAPPPSNISSGFIVDTRSRTINTASRCANGEDVHGNIYDCNGYGKPLVTPINRRLTLRREVPKPTFTPISIEKVSPSMCRSKSPIKRKAENRLCPPPSTPYQCDIIKTKIPTKRSESGNKLRATTSANVKQSNNPMTSCPVSVRGLKGSTSSLSHKRCASPARQTKSIDNKFDGAKHDTSYTKIKTLQNNPMNRNTDTNSSVKPSRIRPPVVRKPYPNGIEEHSPSPPQTSTNHNKPQWNCNTSCAESHLPTRIKTVVPRPTTANSCKTDETHTSRGGHGNSAELSLKKSLPSLREALNESLRKQPLSRDIKPISIMGKPSSTSHSNRSFVPQLEDIKSSFILLNNKKGNEQKKENVKNYVGTHSINFSRIVDYESKKYSNIQMNSSEFSQKQALPSPKPINEEERQQQLNEIKRKFQSRGFFRDSKYDKIEGLNWITWK